MISKYFLNKYFLKEFFKNFSKSLTFDSSYEIFVEDNNTKLIVFIVIVVLYNYAVYLFGKTLHLFSKKRGNIRWLLKLI